MYKSRNLHHFQPDPPTSPPLVPHPPSTPSPRPFSRTCKLLATPCDHARTESDRQGFHNHGKCPTPPGSSQVHNETMAEFSQSW